MEDLTPARRAKSKLCMPLLWVDADLSQCYDRLKPPRADCPECFGDGVGCMFIEDTRNLSEVGKILFAGIEETKDGLKVRMKSADRALEMLAKHTQIFEETVKLDFATVPTEQLDAIHANAKEQAAAKQAEIRGRAQRLGLMKAGGDA